MATSQFMGYARHRLAILVGGSEVHVYYASVAPLLVHIFSPSLVKVMQISCCPLICWGLVSDVINDSLKEAFGEVDVSGKACCFFHIPVPVKCDHLLLFKVLDELFKSEDKVLVSR